MRPIPMTSIDTSILYFFNVTLSAPLLDFLMPVITFAGTQIFWVILCSLIYLFGDHEAKEAAFMAIVALMIGFLLSELLKVMIARPRPYEVMEWIRYSGAAGGYSMPSGHTVAAFGGFLSLSFKLGRTALFIAAASLVGISRLYLGVHYPSDVAAGALIGILCSFIALRINERVKCFGMCRFEMLK